MNKLLVVFKNGNIGITNIIDDIFGLETIKNTILSNIDVERCFEITLSELKSMFPDRLINSDRLYWDGSSVQYDPNKKSVSEIREQDIQTLLSKLTLQGFTLDEAKLLLNKR